MATSPRASVDHPQSGKPAAGGHLVEYEAFIENQLKKTRSHVRSVDFAAGTMILLGGTLAYFFLAAMMDHWLIPGGLGFWGRLVLLAIYLAAATWWVATEIVPLLVKRINPLYAAHSIEQSRPTLKNTLLNFLMFRANPAGVHERVFQAIEEQAATRLAGVQVDSAVDRTRLIRLGYVLVGILAVWALYTMLAPKDLFQTVRRVAMPWADINAPTRTTIDEITPGDAQAFRGQQVAVAARVVGLADDGKVILYYTTEDRQIVDRAVELSRPADDHRHVAVLPGGDSSLQQTLSYRIEAGDAVTRRYTITVAAAPTIVVQAVNYEYPQYTGLLGVRVEHQGDIKAIEGTQVTLEALANQDIDSAQVDFDCDDKPDLRMTVDAQIARATFGLSLSADRKTPEHHSYQVTFKNAAGQQNPQPVRHQIEVTRDIAPEIQFVSPRKDDVELAADAAVDLEVVAGDPDFALSEVKLSAAKGETRLLDEKLLDEPWRGQLVKKFRFQPNKLGLKTGDVVDYWAVAVDNKTPGPNRTETARRRIRIVSPSGQKGDPDRLAQNKKPDDGQRQGGDDAEQGGDDKQPRDQQQPPAEPGTDDSAKSDENAQRGDEPTPAEDDRDNKLFQETESQEGSDSSDQADQSGDAQQQPGSEQSVPNDGTDDGEAIERVLKHRQENNPQQQNRDEQQQPGKQDQAAGDQQDRGGDDGQGDNGQGDDGQQSAERQQPSGEKGQEKNPSQRDEQGSRQGSGADKPAGGQQAADKQPGEESPSAEKPHAGDRQKGAPSQDPAKEPSAEQSADKQPAGKQPGQDRAKSGDAKPTDDNSQDGESKAAQEKSGKGAAQKQSPPSQDRQSSDEEGRGQVEKQPSGEAASPDQKNVEHQRGEGTDPQTAQRNKDGQPDKQDPRRQATDDNNTREDGSPQDPATKGQGAQSADDPTQNPEQKPKQDDQQRPDAKGGEGDTQKGESGAGQKSDDDKGGPSPYKTARPRNKTKQPGPDDAEPRPTEEGQSQNQSEHESDSEGQEQGEQSGGGKRGGGQKANKSGTGGAGQNTAADEGASRSEESGEGETADRAGDKREADGKTGQSGSKQGDGSNTKPASGENEQSGGDDAPQNPSDDQSSSGDENPGAGSQGSGSPNSTRPGSNASAQKQPWKPGVDREDQANLDYARKATDLALAHLKDQLAKGQPDQELLDRLGWSREDLEKFVKRWESMRQDAQAPGDRGQTARRELDETLRSLGLRPRATTLKSNAGRDDRSQGYQESRRTTPPPEYTESFKAYTQGTARGGK